MEIIIFCFGFFIFVLVAKQAYDLIHPVNNHDPNRTLSPSKGNADIVNFKQVFFVTFIVTGVFNAFIFSGAGGMMALLAIATFPTMIVCGVIWIILLIIEKLKSN